MPFKKGEIPKGATPFKPGQSGNPKGQPRKLRKLDDLLADILGGENDNDSGAHQILAKLHQQAKAGNVKASEILLDRGYGKPKQTIDSNNTVTLTNFSVKDILDFDKPQPEV